MKKYINKAIPVTTGLEVASPVPLDPRTVVPRMADLLSPGTWETGGVLTVYQGMTVVVTETAESFLFLPETATPENIADSASWKPIGTGALAGVGGDTTGASDNVRVTIVQEAGRIRVVRVTEKHAVIDSSDLSVTDGILTGPAVTPVIQKLKDLEARTSGWKEY